MKHMWIIACLLHILCIVAASDVPFKDCGSVYGKIANVSISPPCGGGSSCILHRGSNMTITVGFKSMANEDKPTVVVHGIIGGIPVPFHLPNADPCKDSGIKCPLKKKSTYIYSATLPVLPIYPKIKVDVKWELKSSTGKDFFCIQISALLE